MVPTITVSVRHPTPISTNRDGETYDVPVLLGALTRFIRDLPPAQRALVQRIAITGVGESGGLVRPDLSLALPMILWHDQRGADYLTRLDAEQRSLVYRVAGLPVNGNYALSKTAWAMDRQNGETAETCAG